MQEVGNLLQQMRSVMKGLQQFSMKYTDGDVKKADEGAVKVTPYVEKDVQWILEIVDKLDVALAERQFEKSVVLIESGL